MSSTAPIPQASLMADKVLYCIPVFYALVVSLVFQVVVDGANFGWMMWWISRSRDDGLELLNTLIGCSIFMAIWELFAAFIGLFGVYGALFRKRFMKKFWQPQIFVWVCHIGIGIWYIVVYYQVSNDEQMHDCQDKIREDGDDVDSDIELCRELVSFRGAPLPYVLTSFILQFVIQTLALYFVWCWRLVLNKYEVVEQKDVEGSGQNGSYHEEVFTAPSKPEYGHRLQDSTSSAVILLGAVDMENARTKSTL
ncbi:hypothetical protein NP233_g13 [Leucocoprinus birnbaumii]|uniref:Uncharacterized protein n=1 Tax=Leucocoprinus birnbaumii TaxID=56174 RepID=A0AAD5W3J4_9AGAR|nr:hypothetical protein NP233_g13 [Leucocoprinus birnbaumii]